LLSMAITGDLTAPGVCDDFVQDVDVIVHVASPLPDGSAISSFEKEIIVPAVKGTQSILGSATKSPTVKRVVLTSSAAALFDLSRDPKVPYTYTAEDWNPVTYEEATSTANLSIAYRASKKFAEQEAWDWVRSSSSVNAKGEKIDLTVFCPPFVLGPWVHPLGSLSSINTSNQPLRDVVIGSTKPSPIAMRPPYWVDVRDLALAHVEAAYIRPETSNKRFVVCSPEKTTHHDAAQIIKEEFPELADKIALPAGTPPSTAVTLDGSPLTEVLGIKYRTTKECIVDVATQIRDQAVKEGLLA